MKTQTSTYKLLGQLTLSLAILTGGLEANAESLTDNTIKVVKGPKHVSQGVVGRDTGETIPFTGDIPNGRLDQYEQLLKELNPGNAPVRTSDLLRKLDPEK